MPASKTQNIEDIYPLSPLQQGMLFQSLLHQDSGVYLMQDRYRIEGQLDSEAFLQACRLVVAAHPVLRTSFLWKTQKQPLQAVHKQVDEPVELIDLSGKTAAEQDGFVKELFEEEQRLGFALNKAPLIRFRLVRLSDTAYELVRSFHHILMDAWCISLIMVDMVEAYEALRQGKQPEMRRPRPYRDYIAWLQQQDKAAAQSFWQAQLAGLTAPTPLTIENAARQNQYREAVLVDDALVRLDEAQSLALTRFCQNNRITANTLFQGAWALLLNRYSGNSDVLFGVTVAGRPPELAGVEEMIGLFINTLPLRVRIEEEQALVPWLQSLQGLNLDMREFEHSALVDIQGWSELPRGQELFDSILVYENAPIDERIFNSSLNFRLDNMEHSVHTHYGLTVVILPGEQLGIRISYDRRRFAREAVLRLLGHLRQLIVSMLASSTAPLKSLEMLTPPERQQLLLEWNETEHSFPLDRTYAELFAEQVALRREQTAAVCLDKSLSYAELDARSSRLAMALIDAGAGPDTLVAVMAERGLGFLTSLIAIFKAGAAYIPLEIKHPPERLAEILRLSDAPILLAGAAQSALADQVCTLAQAPARVFTVESIWTEGSVPTIAQRGKPSDLAYTIFTSGSTGTPKGALIEQRGMLNNIFGKVPGLGLGEHDRIAQTASVAFDISVWQFLAAPVIGATVHILPDETSQDPERLLQALINEQLTLLEAVPAVIRGLLSSCGNETDLSSLRWLMPTGEALPPVLCRDWFARFPNIPLMNAYGPAECSDDVAFYPITEASTDNAQAMPVGRPTANNQLFIVDGQLRPVPVGVPGEICVAGVGVGRGYLNDPERTRAAFVDHPFKTDERFYRTGDLGRYRDDGVIEFLGRRDQQVKIRGHRIELGEIEARLQRHPLVKDAAVVARADARGDQQLVAYWVKHSAATDLAAIKEALCRQLPPYMVPALFIELDALPLNANGKVDRKQLTSRPLDWSGNRQDLIAPRNPTEQALYDIWAGILALEAFGVEDNFFALGGHSLLATQVVSRIRATFEVDLPLKALFEHPTAASLAKVIDAKAREALVRLPAIRPQPRAARMPLSFAQQRLWFVEQLNPGSSQFNIPFALRLSGRLDRQALQQSFQQLIERHEILRTAFASDNGQAYQSVQDGVNFELPETDLSALSSDERDEQISARLKAQFERPFSLAQPPLLRAQLLKSGESEWVLAVTLHHLASDAWSATIALRELAQNYAAVATGQPLNAAPLPIQYVDFALWQREHLQGEVLQEQLNYWSKALAPSSGEASDYLLTLPTDKPRPAVQSYSSGTLSTRLPEDLSNRIRAFATCERQSAFGVVFAAFAVLLHRMSGQSDVVLGTPVSNRSRAETENLLGILLNNLAVRADFSTSPSFISLAQQVGNSLLDAQHHQDLPFEQLVDHLALPRSLSHAPLFQVMVAQQLSVEERVAFPGLEYQVLDSKLTHSEYDLDLHVVTPPTGAIELELMYSHDLFEQSTAASWLARFENLLERLLQAPEKPVAEQPLLTPAEWQHWVVEQNRTEASFPQELTVHEAFEQQAARTPGAAAVVFEGEQLTYGELNERANRLAHYLRTQGVGPNTLVALCTERSLEMLVGMIGILKAGGAYVPLDPAYPTDRLAYMLEDANPALLLTQQRLQGQLPETALPVFFLDSQWPLLAEQPAQNPKNRTRSDDLVYVIYTSGSTGRPKGTLIRHRGVVNLAFARINGFYRPLGANAMRASFNYSFAFDASVAEFILLLDGHTLYITPEEVRFAPQRLVQFFKDTQLDTFECTPAQLKYLIESGETEHLPRFVLFGGDAIDAPLWQRLLQIPNTVFFNTYGPTECSVDAVACRIEPSLPKPVIGRPIANVRAYVLDEHLNPLPPGVAGELHIGGEGVGLGYLNRPELTQEKFIADPFNAAPGARLYKTGDLTRYLQDGTIEYLGRMDHQVKIRGFRVELGEIEAALAQLPEVREAVVLVREDRPGDKRLVAYLVANGVGPDTAKLRAALKERLPDYMVPNHLLFLDALPLTGNGKIDRKALPKPGGEDRQATVTAPAGEIECALAAIWAEVLDLPIDHIGPESNFFHLGGHSLLATVLFAKIDRQFERLPALRQLFERPTLAELAQLLGPVKGSATGTIEVQPRPEKLPLSFAQQRLWFLEQLSPDSAEYNIASALHFTGELRLDWLRQSLEQVVARHEVLRSRLLAQDELVIDKKPDFQLPVEEVNADASAWQQRLNEAADEEAQRPFDLARDSLIRARVLKHQSESQALLLLTLHHTVADDWSMDILIDEVAETYRARAHQRAPALAALPIQYVDYALWQRLPQQTERYQQQLAYWQTLLEDGRYVLELPTDRARSAAQSAEAGTELFILPEQQAARLRHCASDQGVTPYALLLAVTKVLLSRLTGQEDVRVGTPVANRSLLETQSLIGCFLNTLVIRTEVTQSQAFGDFVQHVQQRVVEAQENQDVPFEQVVEALNCQRDLNQTPLFQVMLTLQSASLGASDWPRLTLEEVPSSQATAKFDLHWEIHDDQQQMAVRVDYRAALFDERTVARWIDTWLRLLDQVLDSPAARIGELELLAPAERERMLVDWNRSQHEFPLDKTYAQLFAEQVQRHPERVAAVCMDETLTYGELDARSSRLAAALIEAGAKPDTLVAVTGERGLPLLAMIIGVFKAGAAYVPLDINHPVERLREVLVQSGARILLASTSAGELLDPLLTDLTPSPQLLVAESLWLDGPVPQLHQVGAPQDLAYVIFTSGSTGKPKGAMVEQRGMLNNIYGKLPAIGLCEQDHLAQTAPIAFDISVWQLLAAPLVGATVHILPDEVTREPVRLLQALDEQSITLVELVPSVIRAVLAVAGESASLRSLRWLMSIGEALPPALCRQWFARFTQVPLLNLYGPAECADNIGFHAITAPPAESCQHMPIGRPTANNQLYVLDAALRPVPIGVAGEICTSGVGVGRGYLNDPERTCEAFVPHPFIEGARFYRTGDVGRFRENGVIEYLGRRDHQVKVRGHRIELGEIQARLLALEPVADAVVIAHSDRHGDNQLVAYWVLRDAGTKEGDLRDALERQLPSYMVPAIFISMERLPLNANGKIDRKALPRPELSAPQEATVAPEGAVEIALATLWSEVLNVPVANIGRTSDFFALGGHSLLATVLLARMRQMFSEAPTLRQLFEHPRLAELADFAGEARVQPTAALTCQARPERLPLSFAQQRLWFLEQLESDSAEYNISSAVLFTGELRLDWLQQGLEQVLARHEVLRSRMIEQGDGAELIVDASPAIAIPVEDIEADEATWLRLTQEDAAEDAKRPFNLAEDRLIRARALKRVDQPQTLLLLTLHHTVADDWSMQLLIDELAECYRAYSSQEAPQLPELSVQYVDYSLWQRQAAQDERYQQQLAYWEHELQGGDYVLELPTDRPRGTEPDACAGSHRLVLPSQLTEQLRRSTKELGVTPFIYLLTATQLLLSRLSGQRDVRVGMPVANRSLAETQSLIGCFVNTLIVRTEVDASQSFRDLLTQVKQRVLAAQEHQDVPFEQVVDRLASERDLAQTPLFQVLFNLATAQLNEARWPGLKLQELPFESNSAQFDLDWDLHDDQQQITVQVTYRSALFDADTIARWLELWQSLLTQVVEAPTLCLNQLSLVSPSERQLLLEDWNRTEQPFPLDKSYAELFTERVQEHPERIAAVCQGENLTYAELDARATRLAASLIEAGAGPDVLVALQAERGLPLLTMMVAVFKAGAAYLPLDVNHPAERLASVLAQSQAPILLAACSVTELVGEVTNGLAQTPKILITEAIWQEGLVPSLPALGRPSDLAYVIFTSGSTGTPKGAMVEQRGMLNNIFGKVPSLGLCERDRIAQTASPAFDISVWQFLAAPVLGATVHILPDEIAKDPARLLAALEAEQLSVLEAVPTVIRGLLEAAGNNSSLTHLRWLLPTGEALPPDLCQAWFERFPLIPMMNAYGPAECSDDVAFQPIWKYEGETGGAMPIGRPTANNQLFILDAERQLVPVGVPGEICLAGVGVGRGYLNDPERTRAAFTEHPFKPGERFYCTGDIGRYRADGVIEFLGRRDHQVKVRGHRIELGEIEARLLALDAVSDAAVVVRRDQRGENRLLAYWVPGSENGDSNLLRDQLVASLPHYMVPSAFVRLDKLPLNANGKIDRKALAARKLDTVSETRAVVAPRNENERVLCELIQGLLKVEQASVEDNFFALGGDSIMGLQLIARAKARGLAFSPKQLFQQRTLADLALVAGKADQIEAEQGFLQGELPLLPIQHWLFEQNLAKPDHWNQSLLLTPSKRLRPEHVQATLNVLAQHHDSLRMRFTREENGWHQHYGTLDNSFGFDVAQLLPDETIEARLEPFSRGLALSQGPIVRAVLVELPDGEQRLYWTIHHLVIDTVSWRILLEDFALVYGRLERSELPALEAKTSSYRQWSERLTRFAASAALNAEREYWAKQGGDMALPVDNPDAPNLGQDHVCLVGRLSAQETKHLLHDALLAYRIQVPELLLTALVQTLCEWKGDSALTVELEGHGREDLFRELDVSRTVGWFTSMFPVCLHLPKAQDPGACIQDPGACIKAVKEQLRAVPARGLGYGVLRYLAGAPLPAPKGGVLFNYLGRVGGSEDEGLLTLAPDAVPSDKHEANTFSNELEIVPMVIDDVLQIDWHFSDKRCARATQERLLARYLEKLRELISHCLNPDAGGFTPSDFPLAKKLNQKSLDKLLGKLQTTKS